MYGKHKNGEPVNIYTNTNRQTLRLVGSVWDAPGAYRIPKPTEILTEDLVVFSVPPKITAANRMSG
jgi:hypothetical protein